MSRAFQFIVAILGLLLITGIPVQAGPVAINEVIQVISSFQNPPDLRLSGSVPGSTPLATGAGLVSTNTTGSPDSLFGGVALNVNDPQQGVEIIAQGDVDGTICDCGEIWVPGGFPRWPLVFLAGIPFIFIDGDDDIPPLTPQPPSSQPTPTPPTSMPEPGSLLLLGSGLIAFGAGMRRRYTKAKLAAQIQNTEEGRVS